MKTHRNFLSPADRAALVEITKDGTEENRVSRRANAIVLLDKGWSFAAIADAILAEALAAAHARVEAAGQGDRRPW